MSRPRPVAMFGIVLVVIGLFAAGAGLGELAGAPGLPGLGLVHGGPNGAAAKPIPRSAPTTITIPAIGVRAPVGQVGLASNGAIAAPPLNDSNLAGWYSGGPAPGQLGSAVIVGHVDGPRGESVFYHLGELKPGQTVRVDLASRRTALFRIYSVEYYPKGNFPGDRVYGGHSRPDLRLITCGGNFVGGTLGYSDNVVVYASMITRG